MKERILGNGMAVTVSDEDADLLDAYGWYALEDGKTWYAQAQTIKEDGRKSSVRMHRLIAARVLGEDAIKGKRVDHIDQHGLNNQRENLRGATQGQNLVNTGKREKVGGSTSRFKGVYLHKGTNAGAGRWRAMIRVGADRISLGYYDTEEQAAIAFDRAAIERYGEFEQLNFEWKHCTGTLCGGALKPEQDFPVRSGRRSGRASRCKQCNAAAVRRSRGQELVVRCTNCDHEICHLCCFNGYCQKCFVPVTEEQAELVATQMASDLGVSTARIREVHFLVPPEAAHLLRDE